MSDVELAADAARAAGAQLRAAFEDVASLVITTKSSSTDLVSDADEAAERLIRERLPADDAVLGEEGGATGGSQEGGRRWIVDPLDGTVNFLFGIPQWCVSIALEGVCGAVYDPCRDELWAAETGGAATLNGTPIAASGKTDLSQSLIATGFAYEPAVREVQARLVSAVLPRARDVRRFGSAALDMVWTAAGRYDGYYEHAVRPWDTAAAEIVCRAVGLDVRALPAGDGLPTGILVGAPELADALEALLAASARG
jgi:myo-inositol-1(or 4)-monophosphatase